VKIVAEDSDEAPGRDAFRRYFYSHPTMRTSSFCVAETLSAFKNKWLRGRIEEAQYVTYLGEFFRLGLSRIEIEDFPLLSPLLYSEAKRLIKEHGIDFIDGLQIVTLLHGRFRGLAGESQSILITADRGLAAAARAERARVWECTTDPPP